jgi:methyl coenzyme M reductase subunit C
MRDNDVQCMYGPPADFDDTPFAPVKPSKLPDFSDIGYPTKGVENNKEEINTIFLNMILDLAKEVAITEKIAKIIKVAKEAIEGLKND